MMKRVILIIALILILLAGFPGCAGKKVKTKPERGYIFYPPQPSRPKFQFLTTFSSSGDIEKKKSKLFRFVAGEKENRVTPIRKPYGVEIFEGIIYVCDLRSSALITMDLNKRSFGSIGTRGPGKLKKPANMDIDRNNRVIYVADTGRNQVIAFSPEGKYLGAYGTPGQFKPSDVKMLDDRIYVCDSKGSQIHVLDKESGKTLRKIGSMGHKEEDLYHPTNISIHDNKIYVSDTTNFRVSIFDLEGKFLQSFGKPGRRPGDFARPKGIDVDRKGRIYVVDSAFENVQVFNREFKLLLFMFSPGGELHNINLPADILIDYDSIEYFRKYLAPGFKPEYLLFVTSQFGRSKVNVYAFGEYEKQ